MRSKMLTFEKRRISSIRSSREADLEERREELRNIRWARHRNQLITTAVILIVGAAVAMLLASGDLTGVIRLLRVLASRQ
jgi:preprotein translocase subunit SecE